MQLYNTLGRRKEEFVPVEPGRARVYVCGITAYDYCHIGHARSAVVFDVLIRQLRSLGLETLYIRNFTDIDDKIINRANKENRDWRELAQTFMQAFHEDMDALGVLRPDAEPRATEHIAQIQELCETLIDKGFAYPAPSGDVYFRVRAYKPYGRLSERNLDELRTGVRIAPGEQKEDPLDFALWKGAKPGEPAWDSPWGPGRPGWHIECSAMNAPYLPLDIHGGGNDLVFPHHENEIAQSEAAFDKELARYWMHNGFVRINSEKMSKSLGNFKTIRAILEDWLPETLRFFLLTKHYRSPIDFSEESMLEAEKGQKRIYLALAEAKKALDRAKWKSASLPEDLMRDWEQAPAQFREAMADDLNTAQALGIIFNQARLVNRILEDKAFCASAAAREVFTQFVERSKEWNSLLGIFGDEPERFLENLREMRLKRSGLEKAKIEKLLEERRKARAQKDFALSDQLRDEIAGLGISVRDTSAGQLWDLD